MEERSTHMKKNQKMTRTSKNKDLYKTTQQKIKSKALDDEMDDTFLIEYKKGVKKQPNLKKENIKLNKNDKFYIKILILLLMILICFLLYHFKTFSHNQTSIITVEENYLFLGDSITHRYDLEKYFKNLPVVNSGKEGDTADKILDDMKKRVYDYNPSKVFLLIGTNDLDENNHLTETEIINNITKIVSKIKKNRKLAKIYIESILPVNHDIRNTPSAGKDYKKIISINKKLQKYCLEQKITFINLYDKLVDENGHIPPKYTTDGLHLTENGYKVITKEIKKYL